MQHSAQNGSGRREERVPLETLIELHSEDKPERIEADGLNVSIGGVAVRATFVPPLGSLFECRFHCPPDGEPVCAQGEVMWAESRGVRDARFGLRFIELDTKSATNLRRYLAPHGGSEAPVDRLRAATLVIDGLGAPVEAELKLADETRIVLEQQLTFLQLGRGVEVSVLGRGRERGRIASVELRHTHFDVPTLVFGILLDDAKERPVDEVSSRVAPLFGSKTPAPKASGASTTASASPPAASAARVSTRTTTLRGSPPPRVPSQIMARASELPAEPADVRISELPASYPQHDPISRERPLTSTSSGLRPLDPPSEPLPTIQPAAPAVARSAAEKPRPSIVPEPLDEDDDDAYALHSDESADESVDEAADEPSDDADHDVVDDEVDDVPERAEGGHPLAARVRGLSDRARVLSQVLRDRVTSGVTNVRQRIEPALREQAETFDLPDAKTRVLLQVARLRAFVVALWARIAGGRRRPRTGGERRAPQRLRMQRSTLPGIGPNDEERGDTGQRTRIIAAASLGVAGIALGVYALAPRSGGADRIQVPERVEESQQEALALDEGAGDPAAADPAHEEGDVAPPAIEEAPVELEVEPAAPTPAPSASATAIVGDPEVPNGRTFLLGMNGPVQTLQPGPAREDGFTIRIPGRRAGDPAAPIASQHKAVSRAVILNRSGYAELTIDFVPGVRPRYQVRGKDNALEITIERVGP